MRRLLPIFVAALLQTPSVRAQICAPPDDGAKISIMTIGTRFDLHLDDGRILTLPTLAGPRATPQNFPARAAERLAQLTAAPKSWRALGGADRWGRSPALIFLDDGRRLDEVLLAEGFFLLAANPGPCADAARAAETAARTQKIGLWADPDQAVVEDGDFSTLPQRVGALTVLAGKIHSIGHGRSALFFNLGPRRDAPALVVAKKRWPAFLKAGFDEKNLIGRPILARGVVELGASPLIELFHPTQIDVMDVTPPANP